LRNYIENSEDENDFRRANRYSRKKRGKVLFVDDGGIGEINARYDNTKQLGMESMERERMELNGNRLDRELEEREFQNMKRNLQRSKDEFIRKEHILRQSRNKSNNSTKLIKRIPSGSKPS
jgi:hypothetical protein